MGSQSLKMKYSNIDMCFLARLFHQAQTSFFRRAFSMHFRFIYLPTLDTQQHYAVSALPTILYCGAVVGGMEFLPASQCQGHPQQLYVHRILSSTFRHFHFSCAREKIPLVCHFFCRKCRITIIMPIHLLGVNVVVKNMKVGLCFCCVIQYFFLNS